MSPGWSTLVVRTVLLLLLAGCLVQIAAAAETYQYVAKWGSEGAGDGQFGRPVGIGFDGHDRVYVAEEVHDRVQAFDANGTYLFTLAGYGSGTGQVNSPQDVAVDAAGTVYVADMYNYRVQKFAPGGTFLGAWGSHGTGNGQFGAPVGLGVDAAGHVYVADFTNHRIQVFDTNGTFIRTWGSRGSGDGQFQFPMGVAVGVDGYVYVVDDDNYRVQVFDPTGAFVRKWGSDAQFTNPRGIAIDGAGCVYVADSGRHEIQKFTPEGAFIASWGQWGHGDGEFIGSMDVAVDAGGETAWVVDTFNYRIQRFGRVAADFSADTTSGAAPLAVQFTDASSGAGITERTWTFGDGATSNETNPSHAYTVPGNYTVTLTVTTASATVTETKTGYVTVSATPAPVANFTANATAGLAPLAVAFTDTSTGDGVTNWSWAFGDGAVSSERNPVHVYAVPGSYDVTLTVTNAGGSDSEAKAGYITVTEPPIAGADRAYFLVSTVPGGADVYLEDIGGTRYLQGTTAAGPLNVTICLTCTPVRRIVATLPGYLEAAYAITAYPVRGETVAVCLTLERGSDGPFPGPHVPATVIQAEDFDAGGEGVAYHDTEPANLGGAYRNEGVDIETGNGVTDVGWIRAGESLQYSVDTSIAGNFYLTLQAANPDPARKPVVVYLDGTPVTEVEVRSTGGWTTYAEFGGVEPLYLRAGRHSVTLAFQGVDRINLDWLRLAAGLVPAGGGQPYPSAHVVPGRVEAEDYDTGGFSDTTPANEGGAYRNDPVDIEAGGSNYDVGWIRPGEYLQYSVDAAAPGTYAISFRVANPGSAKPVAVLVNGGAWVLTIPATGSFGAWQTATLGGVPLAAGRNTVRVETGRAGSFNLDYLEFATGTPTVTPTSTTTVPTTAGASFAAAPLEAPRGTAVKFTLTPAAGKTVKAVWWSFDAPAHLNTWNSRAVNPAFYYPAAGTFSPLVRITYTDDSVEEVRRAGYIRAT